MKVGTEGSSQASDKKHGNQKETLLYKWLYGRLEELQKKMRCFVHYVGWNNRYDSWTMSCDVKVTEKVRYF